MHCLSKKMNSRKRCPHTGSEGKRRAAPVGRWEDGWSWEILPEMRAAFHFKDFRSIGPQFLGWKLIKIALSGGTLHSPADSVPKPLSWFLSAHTSYPKNLALKQSTFVLLPLRACSLFLASVPKSKKPIIAVG